jgi:Cu+-exporting ATPase
VTQVVIDVEKRRAEVETTDSVPDSALLGALDQAGYPGKVLSSANADTSASPVASSWSRKVFVALGVAAFLFGAEWFTPWHHAPWFAWLAFSLGTVVQIYAGAEFYRGAWAQAKRGHSSMDTLVALGSTAAYGWSVYTLFNPAEHAYFGEAAAILGVVSLGHSLESRWSQRATTALRALLQAAPTRATVRSPEGRWESVTLAVVRVGDHIKISPGDQIPVDGVIGEGAAAVDESLLNGEAMPVEKAVGDWVYAGTVNQQWSFVYEAKALGRDTALNRIVQAVERAQSSKAKIQRLADRVSSVFVPLVILVAGATLYYGLQQFTLAEAIRNTVAVLIVACPCAMGIATPIALAAALQVAARSGVIVRDASALEKCGRIQAVYFDKTGTLTEGRPEAELVQSWPGAENAASLTRALTASSKHPLSRALFVLTQNAGSAEILAWNEQAGAGVSGVAFGKSVRLGSLPWLEKCGVSLEKVPAQESGTLVGLSVGPELRALYRLHDKVKANASASVRHLRATGLTVGLISGDRTQAVTALAQTVGIDPKHVHAGVRPEEKAHLIETFQGTKKKKRRIAFVGDGINDGPALAQADLGIAVLQASDVARESAAVVLLRADIEIVADLVKLSRRTRSIIWQNLFWAFGYNILLIPLAATGHMAPGLCAVAMGLSDLCVVGNSLRLLRKSA